MWGDVYTHTLPSSRRGASTGLPTVAVKKGSWAQEGEVWGHASINFSTMLEAIDFDLDNCYVITYDGRLLKQARGIPMGSALSPPLAIGAL